MPDAPMTTGCTQPGQAGNSVGVGKFCTKGGNQCRDNGAAIFCTVDYVPDVPDWYCTAFCTGDGDCGDNAYCSGSGMGGRGCIPARCGGTPSVDASTRD
jgi:hypothetical protein